MSQHFVNSEHALVTGMLLGALSKAEHQQFLNGVSPVMDGPDYTNQIMVQSGSQRYLITCEPMEE